MNDCIDETLDYLDDGIEDAKEAGGQACVDAFLAYETCWAKAYNKSCDDDSIEDECEAEYNDRADDCNYDG